MFTGIIEELGVIKQLNKRLDNLEITIETNFTPELKIDQSIAHNGICLTVVDINKNDYTVTAIKETLNKTNLNTLNIGDVINLERAMKLGERLDGHIVQGHIDHTAICTHIENTSGSWIFTFEYSAKENNITIEKGSITINGVSLTVVNSKKNVFSVAIIPYTYNHTNVKNLKIGSIVNLEFDVIGKYVKRLMNMNKTTL